MTDSKKTIPVIDGTLQKRPCKDETIPTLIDIQEQIDAFEKVSESIDLAINTKKRKILFITGKGLHSNYEADPYASKDLRLLKYAIPEFIKNEYRNKIVSIKEAPQKYGGDGAIIVFLKK